MELKALLRANMDRVVAVALVVVGLLAIIIGWIGVSGTGLAAEQNPYLISGGIFGIALIGVGCTVWVSADLQDEWRRLDRLQEHLESTAAHPDRTSVDTVDNGAPAHHRPVRRRSRPLDAKVP